MLTLATMLRGDYSKALVDELTNNTYKKLLDCSLLKTNVVFPFEFSTHSYKMQKIREFLEEYNNVVNPFGNKDFKIKEPIGYLDSVKVQLSAAHEDNTNGYLKLTLTNALFETFFSINSKGWTYRSSVPVQKSYANGSIRFFNYYENESKDVDEIVYLDYHEQEKDEDINETLVNNIVLRISLKSSLAWKTYKEAEATLATDEQLDVIISHLKMNITYLKESIIGYIVDTEA